MDAITALGLIGALFTTASFVPQVVKTYRTRSAKDVSFWMFAILLVGIVIWIAYGILIRSLPILAANVISFLLTAAIIVMKVLYK